MAPGVVEDGEQQQEAPPPRPPLAVEALRDKIVEKVKANRVTLIVGDTGCGNSRGFPSPIPSQIGSTVCVFAGWFR
jgi:HrpA-like RNA helicase